MSLILHKLLFLTTGEGHLSFRYKFLGIFTVPALCIVSLMSGCRIRFEIAYNFDAVVHAQYVPSDCQ